MFVGDEFIWPPLVEVSLSIAWAGHFAQGPLRKVELVPLTEIPDGGDLSAVYGGNRREEGGRCRRKPDIANRNSRPRNEAENNESLRSVSRPLACAKR